MSTMQRSVIPAQAQGCPGKQIRMFPVGSSQPGIVMPGLDLNESGHDGYALCQRPETIQIVRVANFPGQPCAKAGIHNSEVMSRPWTPACAGVTSAVLQLSNSASERR